MCRPGDACGCGGGSAAPVGLAVAVVALAAVVSAASALIGQVLLVVLVAVYAALGVAVAGLWWLLRREGVFKYTRRSLNKPEMRVSQLELPAPPRAIGAGRVVAGEVLAARAGERVER